MSVWNAYLRWRHSMGFGVHSPFAYKFVTDVLRPGDYGYYAYGKIGEQLKGPEKYDAGLILYVKFLIRLAIFLKTGRIITLPDCRAPEIAAKALNISFENLSLDYSSEKSPKAFEFLKNDLFIIEGETDQRGDDLLQKAILSEAVVMARQPGQKIKDLLSVPRETGLLLYDSHTILLMPRREMRFLSYPLTLRFRP